MRQKVANYPGVTVEKRTGRAKLARGVEVDLVDLPGVYSRQPRSDDEQVTHDVLHGSAEANAGGRTPWCWCLTPPI